MALGTAVERELDHASRHATRLHGEAPQRGLLEPPAQRRTRRAARPAARDAAPAAAARSRLEQGRRNDGADQQRRERHAVNERRTEQQIALRQGDGHRRAHGNRGGRCERQLLARRHSIPEAGTAAAFAPRRSRELDGNTIAVGCSDDADGAAAVRRNGSAPRLLGRRATKRSCGRFAAEPRPSP